MWTAEQAGRFLAHHAEHRSYAAARVLAIVGGLRCGELPGLEWDRVDLAGGVLQVHWQRATTSRNERHREGARG